MLSGAHPQVLGPSTNNLAKIFLGNTTILMESLLLPHSFWALSDMVYVVIEKVLNTCVTVDSVKLVS